MELEPNPNLLRVPLSTFIEAIQAFMDRWGTPSDVYISHVYGKLTLASGNAVLEVDAAGQWKDSIRFSRNILLALAKTPPSTDPLPIGIARGQFFIGELAVPYASCHRGKATLDDLLNLDAIPPERFSPPI